MNILFRIIQIAFPTGVLIAIAMILVIILIPILEARRKHLRFRDDFLPRVISAFLIVALSTSAVNFLIQWLDSSIVSHSTSNQRGAAFMALASGIFGLTGFALKLWKQSWYGAMEIIIGVLLAYNELAGGGAILQVTPILRLLTAVYVIIRGLSNFVEGFDIEKPKNLNAAIVAILHKTASQKAT
jgi:hypothetical protein